MHKMSQNINFFFFKLKMQQVVTERFPSRGRQAYRFSALWWVQAWYISSCEGFSEALSWASEVRQNPIWSGRASLHITIAIP